MFVQISSGKNIEVYYMNKEKCDSYNEFHGYNEDDRNYITEGYYYENMIGNFKSQKEAIEHAKAKL